MIVAFLLLMPLSNYAQFVYENENLYTDGTDFIISEEYKEAIPLFQELVTRGFNNANLWYKLGRCFINIPGNEEKGRDFLIKAVADTDPAYIDTVTETSAPPVATYFLAIAHRKTGEPQKSISLFRSLLKDPAFHSQGVQKSINREIEISENALKMMTNPIDVTFTTAGNLLNDARDNYHAVFTENGREVYYMYTHPFYDAIYHSTKKDGKWKNPDNLTVKFGSDGEFFITGISSDGSQLLLKTFEIFEGGDIYISAKDDKGEWQRRKKLEEPVNSPYNEEYATFSPNGEKIYFTSTRPGGYGGTDIYVTSRLGNEEWSVPENLGADINSPYNEATPFITPDNSRMFFSSEGHNTMGGYDIFYSDIKPENVYGKPVNIGYPLNTAGDNLFYFPLRNGTVGYISEVRPEGSGGMDLYYVEIDLPEIMPEMIIKGFVRIRDNINIDTLNIAVSLIDRKTEKKVAESELSDEKSYSFKVPEGNYKLEVVGKNIKPAFYNIDSADIENQEALLDDMIIEFLEPGEMEEKQQLPGYILFGFDQQMFKEQFAAPLNLLARHLAADTTIQLTLIGRADNFGDSHYNEYLSEKRAATVKQYLVNKGIDSNRIKTEALGETSPLAKNKYPNGQDSPEGRIWNRSVEIQVNNAENCPFILKKDITPKEIKIN